MSAPETQQEAYTPHLIIPRLDLDQAGVRPETIRHHVRRYGRAASYVQPGAFALDICCGMGYGTSLMKNAGAEEAVGIDVSEEAIMQASIRYPECAFVRASAVLRAASMAASGEVQPDVVALFEAIEHIDRPDVNPDHIVQWEFEELRSELSGRFGVVDMFGQDWATGDFTHESPEQASFIVADCSAPLRD